MNKIIKPTFTASITIGMQIGYSKQLYNKSKLIKVLQRFQKIQISERKVYLSACISKCEIVLSGQIEPHFKLDIEPHFKLDFVNYPKFPLSIKQFKYEVELLTKYLLSELNQNRILIIFHDETIMLEQNNQIDPRI